MYLGILINLLLGLRNTNAHEEMNDMIFSVDFPMNVSAPPIDRMSNIYNNSVVRFWHYVFHDLSGKIISCFIVPRKNPACRTVKIIST